MQTIQQYTRDLYGWASEWATRLKTREVGDVCINRWDGKMRREIVPLKKRLSHLILYSRPMDVIDRWGIVRYLLDAENIHEGHDMKKPSSAARIPDFIKFYKINMDEFENPDPNSYGTFNDFFTRRLKPGMRPIAFPDDPSIIVSPADSRVVVFEHVKTAHELWLKGKYFTLEKLIQDKGIAQIFADGAIASVRLAPQDYHHYHSPVEGYVRAWKKIDGTYYGVDGPAIKSDLDVLGSNSRCWILIETKEFGLVLFVAIGATNVGSVQLREEARETGYKLEKGEEIGLFAYGGSSVIVAFENNRVQWDEDLLANTARGLETSVLLGYSLGKAKKHPAA